MNINELLDELEEASFKHGYFSYSEDAIIAKETARAVVDAEIKRMQDRIADLEAKETEFKYDT